MPLQARLEDSGKYLCWVNNTAGEETIQVSLTVTGKWVDRVVRLQPGSHSNKPIPLLYSSVDSASAAAGADR